MKYILCLLFLCTSCASHNAINSETLYKAILREHIAPNANNPLITAKVLTESEIFDLFHLEKDAIDMNEVVLGLNVEGLPCGSEYDLYMYTMAGYANAGEFIVDELGKLQRLDGRPTYSEYFNITVLAGHANGEEVSFILIPKDGGEWIIRNFSPSPVYAEWEDGASVELVACEKSFELFLVLLRGFQPNEAVMFTNRSLQEKMVDAFEVDEIGCKEIAVMPAVIGHPEGGLGELTFQRLNNKKTKTLKYYHGPIARKKNANHSSISLMRSALSQPVMVVSN